jgi:hypothetical protein
MLPDLLLKSKNVNLRDLLVRVELVGGEQVADLTVPDQVVQEHLGALVEARMQRVGELRHVLADDRHLLHAQVVTDLRGQVVARGL